MNASLNHKRKISNNFSGSVSYYNQHAGLQKKVAERLSKALEPWRYSIGEGPILEIGAGTGFFTRHLLHMYEGRKVIVSDLSGEMIQFCKEKFGNTGSLEYRVLDAEEDDLPESTYALITGNFVAQWFEHPGRTISKIAASLKPGGLMLISFPASESFSNWKKYCLELGLPYTGNPLPDLEKIVIELSMGSFKVDYYEDDMTVNFESVYDFFRHLKRSGTSTSMTGKKLSVKQIKLLNDYWLDQNGGQITVHYHTAFIALKRDVE